MNVLNFVPARYREPADPLRTERRVELFLILAALLLILQIAYSASRLALLSLPAAIIPAADSLQVEGALSVATVAAKQSDEIRNRPLFWASRRPLVAVDTAAVDQAEKVREIDGIQLLGVFGSGDAAGIIALVEDAQRRILLGEKVIGWRLESVTANEASFTAGARSRSLTLQAGTIAVEKQSKSRKKRPARAAGQRSHRGGDEQPNGRGKGKRRMQDFLERGD